MKPVKPNHTQDRPNRENALRLPQLPERRTEESPRPSASVNGIGDVSSRGSRSGRPGKLVITDGPFAESKELLGGSTHPKKGILTAEELATAISYLL
jgi:hypothetical protein